MKISKKVCASFLACLTLLSSTLCIQVQAKESTDTETAQDAVTSAQTENVDSQTYSLGDLSLEKTEETDKHFITDSEFNDYVDNQDSEDGVATQENTTLPTLVDNSTSPYFPAIGSQGNIGSCTTWAEVYYQYTYAMNKAMGRTTTPQNTFQPLWIYSFANGGNSGSVDSQVYDLMKNQGNLTYGELPDSKIPVIHDADFLGNEYYTTRSWSPEENYWKNSSDYRVSDYSYVNVNGQISNPNDDALTQIKTFLNNGEVLTFSTGNPNIGCNWDYRVIESSSEVQENNSYVGEHIAISSNDSYSGGHRMTIVGYNDNLWVDMNGNGQVDSAEKGAFKVANSWGSNWSMGNDGYIWVSYDALNRETAVPVNYVSSSNNTLRVDHRQSIMSLIARIEVAPYNTDSDYYLSYTLNSSDRAQTKVTVTANSIANPSEEKSFVVSPYSVVNSVTGRYSYDGTSNANDGTMCLNLCNVISDLSADNFNNYNWSVRFQDNSDDSKSLTVKDAKIVNSKTNKSYQFNVNYPFTLNGSDKTVYMSENPQNLAVVYYRGFDNPNIHYKVGNGSWTTAPGVQMIENDGAMGYADYKYKYVIDLGSSTDATVCFNDGNGVWDNNNTQDYKVYAGNNTFVTANSLLPTLTVDSVAMKDGTDETVINKCSVINVTAHGGCSFYKDCNMTCENLSDGRTYENDFLYKTGGTAFYFRTVGTHKITTTVTDYSGNTATKISYIEVKNTPVSVQNFTATPNNIQAGQTVTFNANTINEQMSYPNYNNVTMTISKNGSAIAAPVVTRTSWSITDLTSSYEAHWIPGENGEYTAKITIIDYLGVQCEKTLNFTVGEQSNTATIYYKGYDTPYIHYQVGTGSWTNVPGVAMIATNEKSGYTHKYVIDLGTSTYANVCFNDGQNHWENNNGNNYRVTAGMFTVENGVLTPDDGKFGLKSFTMTPADGKINTGDCVLMQTTAKNAGTSGYLTRFDVYKQDGTAFASSGLTYSKSFNMQFNYEGTYTVVATIKESPYADEIVSDTKTITVTNNKLTIYYKGFENPYIHYQVGTGSWTDVPGVAMIATGEKLGYTHKYTINLGDSAYANVCFNDGNNNWDSNNGNNYYFTAGNYTYQNGVITKIS